MRTVIYTHVVAVALSVCFSLADRGLFFSYAASMIAMRLVPFVFPLVLLAWLVCPIAAIVIYRKSTATKVHRWAVAAEVALWCAQYVALLPSVQ